MKVIVSTDGFLTAMEAARRLNVSDTAVRKRIANGSTLRLSICWAEILPISPLVSVMNSLERAEASALETTKLIIVETLPKISRRRF